MKLSKLLEAIEVIYLPQDIDTEVDVAPYNIPEDFNGERISFYYLTREANKSHLEGENSYAILTDVEEYIKVNQKAILVSNARFALAEAYRLFYGVDVNKIKLIGVTGTNGKTTVSTIIYQVLQGLGHQTGFIGTGRIESKGKRLTDNFYSMTTPSPGLLFSSLAKMIDDGCEWCVMEVSSHSLSQSRIGALKFETGVFTNLSMEHSDYHVDMEDYFKAKMKLLNVSKLSIINIDDDYGLRAYESITGAKCAFGKKRRLGDYILGVEDHGFNGSSFYYRASKFITKLKTPLPTEYNVYNVGIAFSTLVNLGFTPIKIKNELVKIKSIEGRLQIIREHPTVIIDYAHTPKATSNLLEFVNTHKFLGQNVISVFGCGGERDRDKRSVIGEIIISKSHRSIITEDNSRGERFEYIINDITRDLATATGYEIIPSRKEAIERALEIADRNDIVLIIGKGHEKYIIDSGGRHPFDEREIVEEYYRRRDEN